MKLMVDEQRKLLQIWLTNEEQNDSLATQRLTPYYEMCKAKKYKAVVFRSGTKDLPDLTEGMLLHNRTAIVRYAGGGLI